MSPPPDIGAADAVLTVALRAWAADPEPTASARVQAALLDARLFVPVVARLVPADDPGADQPSGRSETAMSLPRIFGRDGRPALPAFTSVETMAQWRAEARPVPVAGSEVFRTVETEGCSALLVDVAGPVTFVVEGQALHDLAAGYVPVTAGGEESLAARTVAGGLPVVAPVLLPDVEALEGICAALRAEPLIAEAFLLAPAEGPQASGLTVALVLDDEMDSSEVVVMVRRVAAALARRPFVTGGLDLAVLTPDQRRQAHAFGPPAYTAGNRVAGLGR